MTDVVSEPTVGSEPTGTIRATAAVPAPVDTPAPASAGTAPASSAPTSTVDAVKERAADLAEKAGDLAEKAGDLAEKAGGAVQEAAAGVVTRIRNNATLAAARGKTTIGNEVVEKIAGIAAREVPGVFDLGGDVARVLSAVKEKLRLGEESAAQGVSVKLEGKAAEISITIVIEFGFQVFSVTEKVREKVISSVENLLGLEVTGVDVTVDDVHVPDDGAASADAERAKGYVAETKAIVVGQPES
jgi:uncharacterized alkaline shock family protein YloU